MTTPRRKLYLGGLLDQDDDPRRTGEPLHYERHNLTTHGIIVGMTGSGKTGLGMVLLEEVLSQGVPALILDPKGDMGNLLLGFPGLSAAEFEPWLDAGQAQRDGLSIPDLAEKTAARWTEGLGDWQLGGDDIRALHKTVDLKIWTPGSTAGAPINVVGSLRAPTEDFDDDAEGFRAEIESFVSSLLVLADIDADPISSREHILLCLLIEKSWRAGRDLDLGTLITQVSDPPIRRLGVFELDAFFPPKYRQKFAMRLNGLVASPSFSTWMQGEALDVQTLLYAEDGRPRASVVYLPHLSEEQRQFVVTLILSKVVSWMRKQPGTSDLRALVYMDEVYGFAPPTRNPPSKKPILTLLKQARAHGIGVVLSTQNPIDLDYKAMSNAGTWIIGRLSTERDKARILEALRSAAGDVDVQRLDRLIGALGKRSFVMLGARQPEPLLFTTRWALSFLRGPLTRDDVGRLARARREGRRASQPSPDRPEKSGRTTAAGRTDKVAAAPPSGVSIKGEPAPWRPAPVSIRRDTRVEHPDSAGFLAEPLLQAAPVSRRTLSPEQTTTAPQAMTSWQAATPRLGARRATSVTQKRVSFPPVAAGVPVRFLHPSAPWAEQVGADPYSGHWQAALIARVQLRFSGVIDAVEEWEAVAWPLRRDFSPAEAREVDWDQRDLTGDAPAAATITPPEVDIEDLQWWQDVRVKLHAYLDAQRTVDVFRNSPLQLVSRLGEGRSGFAIRCRHEADRRADRQAAERSTVYANKINTWRRQLDATTYKIDQADAEAAVALSRALQLEDQASLLAATLKGQLRAREVAAAVAKRQAAQARQARAQQARGRVTQAWADLAALEVQLGDELSTIVRQWDERAEQITAERMERQAEVHLAHVGLLWMPVSAS